MRESQCNCFTDMFCFKAAPLKIDVITQSRHVDLLSNDCSSFWHGIAKHRTGLVVGAPSKMVPPTSQRMLSVEAITAGMQLAVMRTQPLRTESRGRDVTSPRTTGLSLSLSLASRALSFFWKCSSSSEPANSAALHSCIATFSGRGAKTNLTWDAKVYMADGLTCSSKAHLYGFWNMNCNSACVHVCVLST